MLRLGKYSLGIGDRFAHQAKAQLQAFVTAAAQGIQVTPVWNKSNREHVTIGSEPSTTRAAADAAVRELNWTHAYHVDADHIRVETVDRFIAASDFYTIDVADSIGRAPSPADVNRFVIRHPELCGRLEISGLHQPIEISKSELERITGKYLFAVQEAGKVFRHIEQIKGAEFITEVSMDETDSPQTPPELLVILAALSDEHVPVQTVAPKFTGRFNKGVDYVGDLAQFEKEFNADLAVIRFAIDQYGLPDNLKLSVHSGSDKFSIYPPIRRAIKRFDAGLHVKTAGTTWLEELIGLAEAGGEALSLAKEVYSEALSHLDELCAPYASVIDIDPKKLPSAKTVEAWSTEQYVTALRHEPGQAEFNPSFRQLLHVGYKIAAKMGDRYLQLLRKHEKVVSRNVTTNILNRHLLPLFGESDKVRQVHP
jgi:tagaturonate epimerase